MKRYMLMHVGFEKPDAAIPFISSIRIYELRMHQ